MITAGSGWPGRLLAAVGAVLVGLLAVALFAAFAVVAVVVAVLGLARLWWLRRRMPGGRAEGIVVDYQVAPEPVPPRSELPPSKRPQP